jgi:AraC family transcriptional regulator of adaptative response / DNA-3-methyladenine glycosylase II
VLLAKQLIHQTDLPMIDVALASGFGSVRRFNEIFQRLYDRPPSQLRRHASAVSPNPEVCLLLPYRPPYNWAAMLRFLKARAIQGVEVVTPRAYSRTIEFDGAVGSIHVAHAPAKSSLYVRVRFPRLNALPTIIARIRRQFDLGADPSTIASVLSRDPILAPLVALRPGLRVPGGWDEFEIAVRAILGQQITVKAATTLAARIVARHGDSVAEQTGFVGLTHIFPRPMQFKTGALAGIGITRARTATLVGIAEAILADPRLLDPRRDLAEAVNRLRQVAGIGDWTAQYIAMRAMGECDAFLATDLAVQRKFAEFGQRPSASKLTDRAQHWRPWRAYAMLHLWMADADAAQGSPTKESVHALTA